MYLKSFVHLTFHLLFCGFLSDFLCVLSFIPSIEKYICSFIFKFSTFCSRFEKLKAKDNDFEVRFAHLGNLGIRSGVTEFNWDSNLDETLSSTDNEQ